MEARIAELEIKVSFTEDLLEQLNLTIYRQQQQIDLLTRELRSLRQQVQVSQPAEFRSLQEEIPPHY